MKKSKNNETVIQFLKNFLMGFVVTIFESLSLNPLYKLFDGTFMEHIRQKSIEIII